MEKNEKSDEPNVIILATGKQLINLHIDQLICGLSRSCSLAVSLAVSLAHSADSLSPTTITFRENLIILGMIEYSREGAVVREREKERERERIRAKSEPLSTQIKPTT